MVKVINYLERKKTNGEMFFVLVVQGGVEAIKSTVNGKLYFTAQTATVPATFEEDTCKALIGSEFPGSIQKEPCEPYEYEVIETGEIINVSMRNVYVNNDLESIKENVIDEMAVL